MTSSAKRRLDALSQQLVEGIPSNGDFESIPRIRTVAQDSVGPRVQGKVAIVTGANSPTGIGRATCHQLARNGARAIYMSDWDTTHMDTHTREIKELYPDVAIHGIKRDVGDEETGKSVAQIALNWLLQRPTVSSVIIGARNEQQLRQNLDAIGWNLSEEQVATLDAGSERTPTYPYWHQRQFVERNPLPTTRR